MTSNQKLDTSQRNGHRKKRCFRLVALAVDVIEEGEVISFILALELMGGWCRCSRFSLFHIWFRYIPWLERKIIMSLS